MSQKFFAYHIGVHGRLGRKLNRFFNNRRAKLTAAGIHAPDPKAYRPFLREFVWKTGVGIELQPDALAAFECPVHYIGLSLSNDQALSARRTIFENGEFLFWAEERVEKLSKLFADHRLIFLIEVENFATFLPKHLSELAPEEIERIARWPLQEFVWSDLIEGLRTASPEAEIIIAPTEVAGTKSQQIISKLTAQAVLPKKPIPDPISREAIEAFQLAIGAGMAEPMSEDASDHLYDVMGWDQETRIMLSRQYYSEILELYQDCTLVI